MEGTIMEFRRHRFSLFRFSSFNMPTLIHTKLYIEVCNFCFPKGSVDFETFFCPCHTHSKSTLSEKKANQWCPSFSPFFVHPEEKLFLSRLFRASLNLPVVFYLIIRLKK
jgi:hypothetical protein